MNTDKDQKQAPAKAGNEWVALFDGKTTTGWHSYGRKTVASAWKVEYGVLHLAADSKAYGEDSGDLVTDESFEDFHLKLEWKVAPGGNSGILFYVQDQPDKYDRSWKTGPEMQLLDNERHPDAKIPNRKAGDLYDLLAGAPDNANPAGEWNQTEIICDKGRLQFYQNGENILTTTLWDEHWKNLIAHSKFRDYPDFGTFRLGKIVLQDHRDEVWFRNIQVKKL
ncbi:3-keto-disaccharide hydrolase [Pontibacter ruber]|uniref:DUF1080 domain-containing protein n=1 Tax=Pontibacter ruber TaxID=1343895 RepID=A0ABW5CZJ6_9BACT|nr:DUF1080 domain-containing protein [Pontibacter ruber]